MKIIFAFPGRSFSGTFLTTWSDTLLRLARAGHEVHMSQHYSSFVTFSRMKTLGLDVRRGANQKPFGGTIDYDVFITIDSDIVFIPEQIFDLLEDVQRVETPVVSGVYMMEDREHYACVEKWDTDYFAEHGTFQFLKPSDVGNRKYLTCAYAGMGFFACRRGVIENLKYPYFHYPLQEVQAKDGTLMRDMMSEDVAFCRNLYDAGYRVCVNTSLRVGHEKTLAI